MRGVRAPVRPSQSEGRCERDVADPEGDRRLRHTQDLCNVGECVVPRAQGARLLLFLDLAPVAHGCRLTSPSRGGRGSATRS